MLLHGRALVSGQATGAVLFSDVELSFWGGVNPQTGEIIDRHHPLSGAVISGKILAIPQGRGSCTGSGVLLELIMNGHAPAGLVFLRQEEILSLGVIVAEEVFEKSIPVVQLPADAFSRLRDAGTATILGDKVSTDDDMKDVARLASWERPHHSAQLVKLNREDQAILAGQRGRAPEIAMRITLRMAEIQGATELIDVTQAHIDGCIYTGPSGLEFAQKLYDWGARVKIPTTLNAISVDQKRWRSQGVEEDIANPANALADAYVGMGARPTFTCAPYLLETAPAAGEQIVWAESNAVVFANSVLGARTMKYPDFLDICIALTGRAPLSGCHVTENRMATRLIHVADIPDRDDSFYPLLGYCIGKIAGGDIPAITGLEQAHPTLDDLKAFGAAFGTTSGAPMFHIAGVTPDADDLSKILIAGTGAAIEVTRADLLESWLELNTTPEPDIDLVSFGNPHFSVEECGALAALFEGRSKQEKVKVVVTCGRAIFERAQQEGFVTRLEAAGVQFVNDACWCMLVEPIVPKHTKTIMTNSSKFAHYGPGLTGRMFRFGSMADCVEAACGGRADGRPPGWLVQP
jgi:hypothetical protein